MSDKIASDKATNHLAADNTASDSHADSSSAAPVVTFGRGFQNFEYRIADSQSPTGFDRVVVSTSLDATNSTGAGLSYAVTDIRGRIDGVSFNDTITGGGTYVNEGPGGLSYDNAIFTGNAEGIDGSSHGIDNAGLDFTVNGTEYDLFSTNGTFSLDNTVPGGYNVDPVTVVSTDAPCFCAGTMVTTPDGDVAVETLSAGDVVLTAAGDVKFVLWIGRRAVATRFADPISAMPVRIRAGALADHMPVRDSLLSPCHAVLVDGVLVQAGALINGTSIVRETTMPETFTYYHVELADHALILADGMPAETFIDNIDRMAFDNWAEHEALVGTDAEIVAMDYPRAKSARQVPAAIRARLAERAGIAVQQAA